MQSRAAMADNPRRAQKKEASDMNSVGQMTVHFIQRDCRRILRKLWEVAQHAADTKTVDGKVPGGAERLLAQPSIDDFLLSVDFSTNERSWSVHLLENFMAGEDVPTWMQDPQGVAGKMYQGMRSNVETQCAKRSQSGYMDHTTGDTGDGQLISVMYAPSGRSSYCVRTKLSSKEDPSRCLMSDADIIAEGREGRAFLCDQAPPGGGFRNGGKIDVTPAEMAAELGQPRRRTAADLTEDELRGRDALRRMAAMSEEDVEHGAGHGSGARYERPGTGRSDVDDDGANEGARRRRRVDGGRFGGTKTARFR